MKKVSIALWKSKLRGLLELWDSQDQKFSIPTLASLPGRHNRPRPCSPAALVSPVLLDGQRLEGSCTSPRAHASATLSGEALRLPARLLSLNPHCSFLSACLQCLLLGTGDDSGGLRWRCNCTVTSPLLPATSLCSVHQRRYLRPLF